LHFMLSLKEIKTKGVVRLRLKMAKPDEESEAQIFDFLARR